MNGKNIFSTERIQFKEKVQKNFCHFQFLVRTRFPEKRQKFFFQLNWKKSFSEIQERCQMLKTLRQVRIQGFLNRGSSVKTAKISFLLVTITHLLHKNIFFLLY